MSSVTARQESNRLATVPAPSPSSAILRTDVRLSLLVIVRILLKVAFFATMGYLLIGVVDQFVKNRVATVDSALEQYGPRYR